MIEKDGKITEATENELFKRYLNGNWDNCMPFDEYKYRMKKSGVTIKEDDNDADS